MEVMIHFDGACEPRNPGGVGTWGFVVRVTGGPWDGLVHTAGDTCGSGPGMTNNIAEYTALGKALRWLVDRQGITGDGPHLGPADTLVIRGDSNLVVNQVGGSWQCNKEHLAKLRDRCRELLKLIPCKYSLVWVPRAENAEADALSQSAYVAATGKPFPVRERKA